MTDIEHLHAVQSAMDTYVRFCEEFRAMCEQAKHLRGKVQEAVEAAVKDGLEHHVFVPEPLSFLHTSGVSTPA